MNNFISLLDNTLQLNKEDDKSDEEAQEIAEVKVTTDETPRIPKSSSMPSKLTSFFIMILPSVFEQYFANL